MSPSPPPPPSPAELHVEPADHDLAKQALPGHGIPSQDPDPAAQIPLTAEESAREADSVMTGGGAVAGAATGAAVGAVLAGPVGVLVGSAVGVVAGALGGAAAGSLLKPQSPASTLPVTAEKKVAGADEPGREDLPR